MSAWLDVVGADNSDEWLTTVSGALVEVQAETRTRIAQRIRVATASAYPRIIAERGADYAAGWAFARTRIAEDLEDSR